MGTREQKAPGDGDVAVDPTAETVSSDELDDSALESLLRKVAVPPDMGPDDGAVPGLAAGDVVADRFEVIREIGRGGFARVYRARDRQLSRSVAIKLLARRRVSRAGLELFHREAQATARLNHGEIVTLYDWGEWNGSPFLVLELLEGEPLSALLARGPVAEERAWAIAAQVTRAVVHAHSLGVLHLDLKSQNVFVLADGRIKVLDFGLAGLEWADDVPGGRARVAGGTPETMAPEQSASGPTDARTDIWAIGVILYQLLCGRLPARLAADATAVPTPPGASRRAREVLGRTLARDRSMRYPDARALLEAIDQAAGPRHSRPRLALALATVVAAGAATIAAVALFARSDPPAAPAVQIAAPTAASQQLTFSGDVFDADLSPSGEEFTYITGRRELWVKKIGGGDARKVFAGDQLAYPRWLPDGKRILVASSIPPQLVLWMVSTEGDQPRRVPGGRNFNVGLADGERFASAWGGTAERKDILVAPMSGGKDTRLTLPSRIKYVHDLDAAPDDRILATTFQEDREELWIAAPDQLPQLVHSGRDRIWSARWQGRGEGVFFIRGEGSDATLCWVPFPPRGAPARTLLRDIDLGPWISVTRDSRRLLYHREVSFSNIVRLGRDGQLQPVTQGTAGVTEPAVSGDGREIIYAMREGQSYSIAAGPIDAGAPRHRIIRCPVPCGAAAWSPDGSRIAFMQETPEGWRIIIAKPDGTAQRTLQRAHLSEASWRNNLEWLSNTEILYSARRVIDRKGVRPRITSAGGRLDQSMRTTKLACVAAMACGLSACAFEDAEPFIGEAEYPVLSQRTLGHDFELSCEAGTRISSSNLSFQITMNAGDTLLVGADVLAEYTTFADDPIWGDGMTDELVQTWLDCQPGTTIGGNPPASAQLSRTGQNLWQDSGDGNIADAHGTRAIYTAIQGGTHTCWIVFSCSPVNEWDEDDNGKVTIRSTSSIHHYSLNEYPGMSWKLEANVPITSDTAATVQDEIWNAGSTQGDTEVVVRWLPHVSTCLGGDSFCDGLVAGLDFGFDWRLLVYQYYGSVLCNTAVGAWTHETCSENDHHCGVKVLSSVFPIISGNGNQASCGTALSARRFRAFAQMKKSVDQTGVSDLVVHGAPGNPYTNLVIYRR